MTALSLLGSISINADTPLCKGKIYRCIRNSFINKKGEMVVSYRMVPMARLSCAGCERCGWIVEELQECIHGPFAPEITNLKHGTLYRLSMANISTDYETGHVDGYDLVFEEVE